MDKRLAWEQELRDRQTHNYVFPGTLINSTWALRKLVNQPLLTTLQKLGFLLWVLPSFAAAVGIVALAYDAATKPDFSWREALSGLALSGVILLVLALMVATFIGFVYAIQRVIDYQADQERERILARRNISVGRIRRRR